MGLQCKSKQTAGLVTLRLDDDEDEDDDDDEEDDPNVIPGR